MEIERQTEYNGKHILPLPGRHPRADGSTSGLTMSHLLVPACSPMPGHRGSSRPASRSSARSCSSSGSRSGSRARSRQNSRPPSARQRSPKGQLSGQKGVSPRPINSKTYRSSSVTPSIHKLVLNKTAVFRPRNYWRGKK
ncbi:hypothetical protein PoB_006629200 [Plakobranchus ocellatus]|uniref:Uncharacterized protein n=1 Tax=Plakobranchus ocellatus TaxID=259542 RepID=A0AAV4D6Q1_9GAST|nr:hypothetical protein PoB_006629200 [Plakobranchus ocellatus]